MTFGDHLEWDPLSQNTAEEAALADEMKRQEIRNILRSYTGFFDLFAELIQNSLDAVDTRASQDGPKYQPTLWVHIDIQNQLVSVTDNGVGLTRVQLQLFLQPSMSFKKTKATRGNKGVGATYLAYGFNYLQLSTKVPGFEYAGVLEDGREWVEDKTNAIIKPRIRPSSTAHSAFQIIDRGASFTVKLVGDKIRPKDLSWIGATNAEQWDVILRIKTPLGGLYVFGSETPRTICYLKVTDNNGVVTEKTTTICEYLYPHEIPGKHVALSDLMRHQEKAIASGRPVSWTPDLSRLSGIYDIFTAEEIINKTAPIKPRLSERQEELMKEHQPDLYVFFAYSTQVWDEFNDHTVKLRQKGRILRGGMQLATQSMTQGELLTIPLTESTGYQNTTHVVVHFRDADPDLGRKGFQPELVELAGTLSTASVSAFKRWVERLRKDTGQPYIAADAERHAWIKEQEKHEEEAPLIISGPGLFAPEERVPITSIPLLEQDIVALFHQLLAAGVIRGFRVLATSQHQRYDGVVKVHIADPTDKFIYDPKTNPLGIPKENLQKYTTAPMILEYKYNVDALIDDMSRETKFERHIDLIVAWTMGSRWKERYQVIPLLHNQHIHDRQFHGVTHEFLDDRTGQKVFYGVILEELVQYLQDAKGIQDILYKKYMNY
jgi:hypothetical protein